MKKARTLILVSLAVYFLGTGLIAAIVLPNAPSLATALLNILRFSSLGLFLWGCSELAKAKGYHPLWRALGVFTLFGLLVLIILPNQNLNRSKGR